MVQIILDSGSGNYSMVNCKSFEDFKNQVPQGVQVLHNGLLADCNSRLCPYDTITILPRLCGGKGGFGSMLRAIGAQIEATTNNDACRDLSGKRLRDVKCEKMLKDWSEKQAREKEDKRERKKMRLQKILDGPSRLKTEDNNYISEIRSMSESVETAIASAIAEDDQYRDLKLPQTSKTKKWLGDSDSDSEGEEEKRALTVEVIPDDGEKVERKEEEVEEDVVEDKGEIKVTFVDLEEEGQENNDEDVVEDKGEIKVTLVDLGEDESSEEKKDIEMQSLSSDPPKRIEETEDAKASDIAVQEDNDVTMGKITDYSVREENSVKEENSLPSDTEENSVTKDNQETTDNKKEAVIKPDWKTYESPESMLAGLGPDTLKEILSDMGLKCGGTPVMRAERLYSVRMLSKDQIPGSLFATAGKGKKRKNRQQQQFEFVDR